MKKTLTAEDVEFTIEAEPEDIPVRGNAMMSGDDDFDRKVEDEIIADLEDGNEWAWCSVKVAAKWKRWEGRAYLGCCSYKNEKDFCQPGGYFEQMKEEALEDLNRQIADIRATLCEGGAE
jgi:hypothetical protein